MENTTLKVDKSNNKDLTTEIDEFMEAYNNHCSYKYSGTILLAKGDQILLNKGYGMANYEEEIPNESNSLFAIGSITKSFTACAIMQLQEKHLLNVEDPISKYIEGHERGDDITIHQLLTHTSGLTRDGLVGHEDVTLAENINHINTCSMVFEPGEDYCYSNAGYILLAGIIEKVSGQSYADYIKDNIFTTLEMNNSSCGIDDSYAANQAIGYLLSTKTPSRLSIYNFSCIPGSGNIYSTTEDLYKYDRALNSNDLLTEESLDKIFTSHYGASNWGYGYGWEIMKKYDSTRIIHGGSIANGGYNSLMIRYPDEDYVLIFLSNNDDMTALYSISDILEAILFEKDYVMPKEINSIDLDTEILKKYDKGKYDFENGLTLETFYKNDQLHVKHNNGATYTLIPVSETVFYYEDHQCTRIEFQMDENNNVVGIKIFNNASIFEGREL